jgi:hypothetical protein
VLPARASSVPTPVVSCHRQQPLHTETKEEGVGKEDKGGGEGEEKEELEEHEEQRC